MLKPIFVSRWMPDTGGANVPALNDLLAPFGIAFGDRVSEGYFSMGDHSMYYASGTSILRFPKTNESILIERDLHNQGVEVSPRNDFPFSIHRAYFSYYSFTVAYRRTTK